VTPNPNRSITGTVSWIKTTLTNDLFYPLGFSNLVTPVTSTYTNSALAGKRIIELTAGSNGLMTFTDGNLAAPFTDAVQLSTLNKFTAAPTHTLKLSLAPKTGKVTGSFKHPDNGNAVTKFYGAVLQSSNTARGWFNGTNQSGAFLLQGN
jgi:hypothetical protein